MKNKFYIILFMFLSQSLLAENIQIQSKNITLDKDKVTTIFENLRTTNRKQWTYNGMQQKQKKYKSRQIYYVCPLC